VKRFQTARRALKRGGLVAAANWPIVVIQASADLLAKLLMMVTAVAGVVLVVLLVGAEPAAMIRLRADLPATFFALLIARPIAFASFVAAMAVAVIGGSVFIFLVKGGTVSLLVRAEREAGAVEEPPLQPAQIAAAAVFTIERFIDGSRELFPRFARLGGLLMLVYVLSAGAFVALTSVAGGLLLPAAASLVFAVWITIVNLLYLLAQIVMASERCGVGVACRRALGFVRRVPTTVLSVCAVTVGLVVLATAASLVAATALGLISFVPIVGLTVWPLQLLALALRALVLQYIGLTAVGAYSSLYRGHASERPAADPARSVHDADRAQLAHPIDAGSHAVRQARGEAG
jgi:hypothetical protein